MQKVVRDKYNAGVAGLKFDISVCCCKVVGTMSEQMMITKTAPIITAAAVQETPFILEPQKATSPTLEINDVFTALFAEQNKKLHG